jgi:hypothetical protein
MEREGKNNAMRSSPRNKMQPRERERKKLVSSVHKIKGTRHVYTAGVARSEIIYGD